MIICSKCGKELQDNSKFCKYCGSKIQENFNGVFCKNCGTSNRLDNKFCLKCGVPLHKPQIKTKKKGLLISIVIVLFILIGAGFVFMNIFKAIPNANLNKSNTSFKEITLNTTYKQSSNKTDFVTLGEKDSAMVILPPELFSAEKEVTLKNADKSEYKKYDQNQFISAVSPIDISIDGLDYTRLDKPVGIRFKLPDDFIKTLNHKDDIRVSYYGGGEWHYYKPEKVDLSTGYVDYFTYHFSPYGVGKITDEQIMSEMARKTAIEDWKSQTDSKTVHNATKALVTDIVKTSVGITDSKVLNKIIENLAKENDYGNLIVSLKNKDNAGFSTKLSEILAKSISKNVSSRELSSQFEVLAKNSSKVALAGHVSGALIEGDAEEIAKALSNYLLDSVAVGKIFKAGTEVISTSIDCWKDSEIEDMYFAYRNGADNGLSGYNVEKGKFEELWAQSRGITRQISIEAIKSYCNLRGISEDSLSNEEKDKIRLIAKQNIE